MVWTLTDPEWHCSRCKVQQDSLVKLIHIPVSILSVFVGVKQLIIGRTSSQRPHRLHFSAWCRQIPPWYDWLFCRIPNWLQPIAKTSWDDWLRQIWMADYVRFGWLTTSDIDISRYGDGCWSVYEEVGQSTSLISWHQLSIAWAESGKGEKVKARVYSWCHEINDVLWPTSSYPSSIRLHILTCPCLTYPIIQTG